MRSYLISSINAPLEVRSEYVELCKTLSAVYKVTKETVTKCTVPVRKGLGNKFSIVAALLSHFVDKPSFGGEKRIRGALQDFDYCL